MCDFLRVKQGLITYAIGVARAKGVSAYVGDGSNRWPAAHVLDNGRSLSVWRSKSRTQEPGIMRSLKKACGFAT